MGRRSAEEAENHWPGFVDALSTIVMVVTFLLIILAVVIFALSQMVEQEMIDAQSKQGHQQAEEQRPSEAVTAETEGQLSVESNTRVEKAQEALIETQDEGEKIDTATASQATKIAQSEFVPELSEALKSQTEIVSDDDLSVLSLKTEDQLEVTIAKIGDTTEDASVQTVKTNTYITLAFDSLTTKINDEAGAQLADFITSNSADTANSKLTIWSFSGTNLNSFSESQRVAYYRALATRNELIKNGASAENIAVEIRVGNTPETENTVQVTLN